MEYILQFQGGDLDGEYRSDNPHITKWASGMNINIRQREELQGKPTFSKYAGPMWNSTRDGIPVIRYEAGGSDVYLHRAKIFCLYTCDEWKSYSSSRLHMVTTSFAKLVDEIMNMIERGDAEYDGGLEGIIRDSKNDENEFIRLVNNQLTYANVEYMKDGEV